MCTAARSAAAQGTMSFLSLRVRQLVASVTLINALGGGCSDSQREQDERMAMRAPGSSTPSALPPDHAQPAPNPPPIPLGEMAPDEIIKLKTMLWGRNPPDRRRRLTRAMRVRALSSAASGNNRSDSRGSIRAIPMLKSCAADHCSVRLFLIRGSVTGAHER